MWVWPYHIQLCMLIRVTDGVQIVKFKNHILITLLERLSTPLFNYVFFFNPANEVLFFFFFSTTDCMTVFILSP